jgi:hypothetical protein
MIYLLDLNFTLVANSEQKKTPFIKQIEHEQYRVELLDRLRGERVFLLTARPAKYHESTLESIQKKLQWQPERAFFNYYNLPPPSAKQAMLVPLLREFLPSDFFGIESNPKTREMYLRHGIESANWKDFLHDYPA